MRDLYTKLREFAKTFKYLEDLFLPLFLATDAPVEFPPGLHPAHKPFLVVHQPLLRILHKTRRAQQIVAHRIFYVMILRLNNAVTHEGNKMARNV
jgi:hypothetical protein